MSEASPKRVEIIPAKRRALILEYLRANGTASIGELTDAVGGSQSTIRRDLEQLTNGGYLERTHGGALLASPSRATFEREMIRSARRTLLLVDSSKSQAPAFCTFATLAEIGEVITDEGVSGDVAASLGAAGTALTIAPAVRE